MKNGVIRKIDIPFFEFNNLKFIGKGSVADVYKANNEESVIKKYHEKLITGNDYYCNNPCIRPNKIKFRRLNKKNELIKYTDLDVALVYCDGKFIGVLKKLYEGKTLCENFGIPLKLKKYILFDLVRNTYELAKNNIYSLDIKTNNVIFTINNEVKIIDLDDLYTRVTLLPHYLLNQKVVKNLQDTILDFMYYNLLNIPYSIVEKISNTPKEIEKREHENPYDSLLRLIGFIEMEGNVIIVKLSYLINIDLVILKKYMEENGLSLVISYDKRERLSEENFDIISNKFKDIGIEIYDIFNYEEDYEQEFNNYIISHDCFNVHTYEEKFKVFEKRKELS